MLVIPSHSEFFDLVKDKRLLVFDFDGVIADSVEVKTEAFAEMYSSYGEKIERKVIEHHRAHGGMSRFEKFRYYHNELLNKPISESEIQGMSEKFSLLVVDKVISSPEIDGATTFLENCCTGNKICVVNSATPEKEIIKIVEHRSLNKYFQKVYGSPASKTENLLKVLQDFNLSVDDVVFFGDAQSDFNAAKELGILFVGVGEQIFDLLESSVNSYIGVKDFSEIL